jgi:hypothetical protein
MTHHEVLNSDIPIPDTFQPITCCKCSTQATVYWPCVSKDPKPYCPKCLDKAKTRLNVALGS